MQSVMKGNMMKTAKNSKEARSLIREEVSSLKLYIEPTKPFKKLVSRFTTQQATAGIILETAETIVLTTLIVVVGSVIAYAIYHGYNVKLKKDKGSAWEGWHLVFEKKPAART